MLLSIPTSKFNFNKFGLILSKYSYKIKINDILAGKIIGIESNYALVDLGLKQICFLPLEELSNSQINDPEELLITNYIGEFLIFDSNIKLNRIIISLKRVKSLYLWNRLRQLDFANMTIYAKIEKSLGKGKLVIFNGLFFFVLNSNIPKYYSRATNKNLFIPFKFLEVKDSFHIAHISAKLAVFNKINRNLILGSIYLGTVTSIREFGVFVNILGVKCLLHISEIYLFVKSKNKLNIYNLYKLGDQVPLKIISKDLERGRISVSIALQK